MDRAQKEKTIRSLLNMKETDIKEVVITPEVAAKILVGFNNHNRNISARTVEQYARDIELGRWNKSNDTITFDSGWDLSNGQHRLKAVTVANKPISIVVQFHVNQNCEMDRGKQRTISENIQISGVVNSKELSTDEKLHSIMNVCLRVICNMRFIRTEDVADAINKYEKQIIEAKQAGLFAVSSRLGHSGISAAFFAAYVSGVPLEKLAHIRRVLNSGIAEDELDIPVIGLRDKLLATHGGGSGPDFERVKYTQYCIQAVMKGKKSKICRCNEMYYRVEV